MAEAGSWPSIQQHGLLSTASLVGRFQPGNHTLVGQRRPQTVTLAPGVTLRDQKPMSDAGLERCLRDGLQPAEWYRMLNARVFFWLTPQRLQRLLNARPYRTAVHDVLEVDAAGLVAAYRDAITLCAINSGYTGRGAVPRGLDTFLPIDDYPYARWRAVRSRGERVVELAVLGGVPDIARFVRRVVPMRATAAA